MTKTKTTPMMAQFHAIKQEYPNEILFFRMGDFYEMMFDDAIRASEILGITLTKRGRGTPNEAPMCGVPHHAANGHINKLIKAGQRVAICDQVENPKEVKGLVKREVVQVITPGTVLDDDCLDSRDFHYLAAMVEEDERIGLALLEFSTGQFEVSEFSGEQRHLELADLLAARNPAELLVMADREFPWLDEGFRKQRCWTPIDSWRFGTDHTRQALLSHFETLTLDGFGLDQLPLAARAAGAAMDYVYQTQKGKAEHVRGLRVISRGDFMVLDATTQRNLELTRGIFDGARSESLLGTIDLCRTPMGSRLLKEWLLEPLLDVSRIQERQTYITSYLGATIPRSELREILGSIPDLDRQLSKLATAHITPRQLLGIAEALGRIPDITGNLDAIVPDRYAVGDQTFANLWDVHERITAGIEPEPPAHMRAGGYIRGGVDAELDELRTLRKDSRAVLAQIETRERERTNIPKLKVQYNKVFGYYIEVGKVHADKVPDDYVRKQTLVNSERYITEELKEYEAKILGAEERILVLEQDLYDRLLDECRDKLNDLRIWSQTLARIDVHAALAELAVQRNYCKPDIDSGTSIAIHEGRHPVVEALSGESFIPNDVFLDHQDNRLLIITGPNMGGKSTYLRQTALIVLLAQIGSYVPAAKAEIGVVDRIFTRVGASDHLARGQSTFMVEMTETANILNHASDRSLIILDEIGRGTSTFDGLSIAWATAEHILGRIGAKTLFATHYHEMTELEKTSEGAANYHIKVREWQNKIVFLRRIERGAADQSYGIHVAQLAGLPGLLIQRAREILGNLEQNELDTTGNPKLARSREPAAKTKRDEPLQMALFEPEPSAFERELRELTIDDLTPRQALDLLYRWKAEI